MIALHRHSFPAAPRRGTFSLSRSLLVALERLELWAERRRQRRALLGLGDYLLHDIGLSRADAEGEGGKPFWRD